MKQACSLESMVDAVLSEMKRRGNAKNTIERHERAYSQFYEYALTQGENSYSKVLARSFLEEKEKLSAYRGPRFMEQYGCEPYALPNGSLICPPNHPKIDTHTQNFVAKN